MSLETKAKEFRDLPSVGSSGGLCYSVHSTTLNHVTSIGELPTSGWSWWDVNQVSVSPQEAGSHILYCGGGHWTLFQAKDWVPWSPQLTGP